MTIHIECRCGSRLKVDDKLAGRQAKCPKGLERNNLYVLNLVFSRSCGVVPLWQHTNLRAIF